MISVFHFDERSIKNIDKTFYLYKKFINVFLVLNIIAHLSKERKKQQHHCDFPPEEEEEKMWNKIKS